MQRIEKYLFKKVMET